jgi:hypothetical protein
LVLNERHQVHAFGKVSHGRLGLGNGTKNQSKSNAGKEESGQGEVVSEPILIDSLKNEKVVSISAGCRHAGCVTGKQISKIYININYRTRKAFYMGI